MITATAYFDLSVDRRDSDRRVVSAMYAVPNGTRVIVFVGNRNMINAETVSHLGQYVATHHLDFHGQPAAVESWVKALRRDGW